MFTNSMTNLIAGSGKQPEPKVGDGATILLYTDRHACTIVSTLNNGKGHIVAVVVQRDEAKRTDNNGMSEVQSYEYTPNPNASKQIFTLRKNGAWVKKGDSMTNGTRLRIGERAEYYDYSF